MVGHVPCLTLSVYLPHGKFLTTILFRCQEAFNYKIAARPDRRRQFEKELASLMEVALDILRACLNISELTEQVGALLCCLLKRFFCLILEYTLADKI